MSKKIQINENNSRTLASLGLWDLTSKYKRKKVIVVEPSSKILRKPKKLDFLYRTSGILICLYQINKKYTFEQLY